MPRWVRCSLDLSRHSRSYRQKAVAGWAVLTLRYFSGLALPNLFGLRRRVENPLHLLKHLPDVVMSRSGVTRHAED